MEKFSIFRQSEGSKSQATPLAVQGKGCLLDTIALPMHNRTCRSIMGLLVGNASADNRPASSKYFGFNLNFNDVPLGNANALHIHNTFEYFIAFSGDFEIRAGDGARSSIKLNKWDMVIVPEMYKRYFKCVAKQEQMHHCEEMAEEGGQCALILAGIVGEPWVQWSMETIEAAREKGARCTDSGTLIDADAPMPSKEVRKEELDCSQEQLEKCVYRASDRPKVTRPYGDGDMCFEYIDVRPGLDCFLESTRNYVVFNLEGPALQVQREAANAETVQVNELLVIEKGHRVKLSISSDLRQGALVFLVSSDMTEASFSPEVKKRLSSAVPCNSEKNAEVPALTLAEMCDDLKRELELSKESTVVATIESACRLLGVAFAGRPLASVAAHCHREIVARSPTTALMPLGDQHGGGGLCFSDAFKQRPYLGLETLLMLQKWNTPTIFNGWEQITKRDFGNTCFNLEPITDYMPQMGPMVGYAVTVQISPGNKRLCQAGAAGRQAFREHVASLPVGIPKIIVVQDLDKPHAKGSMWGEVNATLFKAIGCVGCIVDGGVRDLDEMHHAGLHAISRTTCIGHAHGGIPLRWDLPVEVFGTQVSPGQLIHADKHGFLAVPFEDEERLLEASEYMDLLERRHTIRAALEGCYGAKRSYPDVAEDMGTAANLFAKDKKQKYG